jgi:hypothetical protein
MLHCTNSTIKLNSGIPTDSRKVDEYLNKQSQTRDLLVQWLEDFKSKLGEYDLAKPTIDEVESALQLYKEKIEAGPI